LHVLISSVAGDGVLTSEGLTVTDPKLSAEAGIQVGDTIRSINGFPVRQAHVALLAMQRDPDRGTVELLIDRQGMRLTQVYVMR
jgi:C-terminal processing protease CtpA/Prc